MARPKLNARKVQTSITLSERDAILLKNVGDGNLSEGIAILIRHYQSSKTGREAEEKRKEEARLKLDPLFG